MKVVAFIKKYFNWIVFGILILIILLQQACKHDCITDSSIVKTDTLWMVKHDTVVKNVGVALVTHPKPPKELMDVGNTKEECTKKFTELVYKYITETTYKDTVSIDGNNLHLGSITVIDTVKENKLCKRTYIFDYKIPTIVTTVTNTIKEEPRRKVYIGAGLFGNKDNIVSITPGLIYKSKKDQIYTINADVDFEGNITYGAGMYWLISFRKHVGNKSL